MEIVNHECYVSLDSFVPIPRHEGYLISSKEQKVFSIKRNKILTNFTEPNGYVRVTLCENNKPQKIALYRLLAETFIPNPNNYPVINHKNCIRNDNRLENLEWCTHSYNTLYGIKVGNVKSFLGKKHTEETKNKISLHRKGKDIPPESRAKSTAALLSAPRTKERYLKISVIQKWKGKHVICTNTNIEYRSIREAAYLLGVKENQIYKKLKNGEFKYVNP